MTAPVIAIDGRTLARVLIDTLRTEPVLATELRSTIDGAAAPGPRHVSPATYARDHELAVSTVRKAIREGRLPATRIGRAVRIPADATIAPRATTPDRGARADRALGLVAVPGGRR